MRSPNLKSLLKAFGTLFLPLSGVIFVLCLLFGEFTLALACGLSCLFSLYLKRGAPQLLTAVGALEKQRDAWQANATIRQEAMPKATPAQSKSVRNWRRLLYASFFSWVVCMFGLFAFGRHLLGAASVNWLPKLWLIGWLINVSLGIFIWRCPICHHSFGRGSGKNCPNCETRFDI